VGFFIFVGGIMAICNFCGAGEAQFIGHEFNNKSAKIFSVYQCYNPRCGALHKIEQSPVGPKAFDIDDPRALKSMLPTEDWMGRRLKQMGLTG
jgi:hypothetical protein